MLGAYSLGVTGRGPHLGLSLIVVSLFLLIHYLYLLRGGITLEEGPSGWGINGGISGGRFPPDGLGLTICKLGISVHESLVARF